LFNLFQRLQNAFGKAKTDDKRQLLRYVFSKMTLDEGKLEYEFTLAFKLLSDAVVETNKSSKAYDFEEKEYKTFEPNDKSKDMGTYEDFFKLNPVVRWVQDSNLCRVSPPVFETGAIVRYANPPCLTG
jgi:hypothetical protein